MPRPRAANLSVKDLQNFVATESDFAFEMQVLNVLKQAGFNCSHAGTYQDPITRKIRQFDLQGGKVDGECLLAVAVECKNLRPNFPLLISAVPRTWVESFHEFLRYRLGTVLSTVESVHIKNSIYISGQMVGKRTDQVGCTENGELFSDDSATFDKISQAINSSQSVVASAAGLNGSPRFRVVIPVLVVPDQSLWQIEYDDTGMVTNSPHLVKETTLFINHEWRVPVRLDTVAYRISHLHIVTIGELESSIARWMGPTGLFQSKFL